MKAIVWLCCLFFAICASVEIHWAVARVFEMHSWMRMDASAWAGWAQALGSIIAIGVAFHIGAKQGKDAIRAIVFGYDHATRRKYEAYSNVAQAAVKHADDCLRVFPDGGFNTLSFAIADLNKPSESLMNALDAIPIHDVGTYNAIKSLVGLKISMKYLDDAVKRADAHKKSLGSSMPVFLAFDTAGIQLNGANVVILAQNLIEALKIPAPDSLPT